MAQPPEAPNLQNVGETGRATLLLRVPAPLAVGLVLLVVVLFGMVRYRLRTMPLERDEGEYAYSGQLMLQGIPPYRLAYNMKLPGIYAAYAMMLAVFGETPAAIHTGLLLINAATTLLLYWLTAILFGRLAAVVAACSYALLSTSTSVMGFEAHATNFVILPALVGILLMLYALRSGRTWLLLAGGVALGIAFLMKQHSVFFVVFCVLCIVWDDRRPRPLFQRLLVFSAGVILPYALTCLLLIRAGVFHKFWFWTVSYAGEYSKIGTRRAIHALMENARGVVAPAVYVWILAVIGLTALLWSPSARSQRPFLLGLLLCSFLALCPGGYFRPHYFVLFLPVAAILVGVAVIAAVERLAEAGQLAVLPLAVFLVCFGATVFVERDVYFTLSPIAVFQRTYPRSPFPAAVNAAKFVRENSANDARIAVLGSEPEIYFYANRHSATGYLYMYSLTERQSYTARMREEMLQELGASRPEFVIYVDEWDSWGNRNSAYNVSFVSRLQQFMDEGYEKVEAIDIASPATATTSNDLAHTVNRIYILRRRETTSANRDRRPGCYAEFTSFPL